MFIDVCFRRVSSELMDPRVTSETWLVPYLRWHTIRVPSVYCPSVTVIYGKSHLPVKQGVVLPGSLQPSTTPTVTHYLLTEVRTCFRRTHRNHHWHRPRGWSWYKRNKWTLVQTVQVHYFSSRGSSRDRDERTDPDTYPSCLGEFSQCRDCLVLWKNCTNSSCPSVTMYLSTPKCLPYL